MYKDYKGMKKSLLPQMCAALDERGIAYEEQYVEKNMDCFGENKMPLINLLRKHPSWNEESLAIIFEAGDVRRSDTKEINALRSKLERIFHAVLSEGGQHISEDRASSFSMALKAICEGGQYIDEQTARRVKLHTGMVCDVGKRASRILDKLCKKYCIDGHEDYISAFTALADALNPISIEQKMVLSVHPSDFIGMDIKDGRFTNLDAKSSALINKKGCSANGSLALLADGSSMVFYSVAADATLPYHKARKVAMQIFGYANGILLQFGTYPSKTTKEFQSTSRHIAQQALAKCLQEDNLWMLKERSYTINMSRILGGVLGKCTRCGDTEKIITASLLKKMYSKAHPDSSQRVVLGHEAYCLKCGNAISKACFGYCSSCSKK